MSVVARHEDNVIPIMTPVGAEYLIPIMMPFAAEGISVAASSVTEDVAIDDGRNKP